MPDSHGGYRQIGTGFYFLVANCFLCIYNIDRWFMRQGCVCTATQILLGQKGSAEMRLKDEREKYNFNCRRCGD